jgi:hypothetical protein
MVIVMISKSVQGLWHSSGQTEESHEDAVRIANDLRTNVQSYTCSGEKLETWLTNAMTFRLNFHHMSTLL